MKSYDQILFMLDDSGIPPLRWYTVDNLIYLHYTPSTLSKAQDRCSKIFIEVDLFKSYNCLSIDMDKQPGDNKPRDTGTNNTLKKKRDRLKEIRDFDIGPVEMIKKMGINPDYDY